MSGNFKKEDLRIVKTYDALLTAMLTLLNRRNFKKITVNDLCGEALVSRATFYAHFKDKYDFLYYWLTNIRSRLSNSTDEFSAEQMIVAINQLSNDNSKIVLNLIEDASGEVTDLLHDFLTSIIDDSLKKSKDKDDEINPHHTILANFCAGGVLHLLSYQVRKKLSQDVQITNSYLHNLIKYILELDKE